MIALEKHSFSWNVWDRYVELLNFEMEVMNILEKKAYEITDEDKVPAIKNFLGQEGLQLITISTNKEKKECNTAKGL